MARTFVALGLFLATSIGFASRSVLDSIHKFCANAAALIVRVNEDRSDRFAA